jgi:hypothetical protein
MTFRPVPPRDVFVEQSSSCGEYKKYEEKSQKADGVANRLCGGLIMPSFEWAKRAAHTSQVRAISHMWKFSRRLLTFSPGVFTLKRMSPIPFELEFYLQLVINDLRNLSKHNIPISPENLERIKRIRPLFPKRIRVLLAEVLPERKS